MVLFMRVLPAIDLMNGDIVRLTQGDFSRKSRYSVSPVEAVQRWKEVGFSMVHIVSLDGAKDGTSLYQDIFPAIVREGVDIQFGGGIRSVEQIGRYFELGVRRVIVGTHAVSSDSFWGEAVERFGSDRLVLALDIKDGFVATNGWAVTSDQTFGQAIERIGIDLVKHVLVTDIRRDGGLSGIDVGFYRDLLEAYPGLNMIPAGGVTGAEDLERLEEIGVREVVVGKALYERPEIIDVIRRNNYLG